MKITNRSLVKTGWVMMDKHTRNIDLERIFETKQEVKKAILEERKENSVYLIKIAIRITKMSNATMAF